MAARASIPRMAAAAGLMKTIRLSVSIPKMPSPAASRMSAVCAYARSLKRQAMTLPTHDQSTNSAWMPAQVHGALIAASWLYTDWGQSTPTTPWWTATKATARRYGIQSWQRARNASMTKKWKWNSM